MGNRWWRGEIGYEVYIRSFADSDGDGIGDLKGLTNRLDHLADLGVGIVWITPWYPSPLRDHGYDVADYRAIAPEYGTLDDVDALLAAAHGRRMRVLADLVPNHTSSDHRWFQRSRSSREDPYRDYYVWRDPAPDGGPPNNWVSHFGGPAWTYDEATGQYWLHLFLPEQPDLNWANPAVADEFDAILRFWFERGVDGFRIDVAHSLVKHPDLPDQPRVPDQSIVEMGSTASIWDTMEHPYDTDQPGVLDVYRRWRKIADQYDAMLLGEVYLLEADRLARYLDDDGLHMAFWFKPLHARWEPAALRKVLDDGVRLALERPADVAWVQGSHDRSRAITRYGGGELGQARALALATVECFLPGTPFVYQGEELGLDDPILTPEEAQDPIALRTGEFDRGRDVARTPIPWAPGPGFGFTTAERPWLPMGARMETDTADVQRDDPRSHLSIYRRLLRLRRDLGAMDGAGFTWLDLDEQVLAYRRGDLLVAANVSGEPVTVAAGASSDRIAFSTDPDRSELTGGVLTMGPHEGVALLPG